MKAFPPACVLLLAGLLSACGGSSFPAPEYPETPSVERSKSAVPAVVQVLLHRSEFKLDGKGGFIRTTRQRYRVLTKDGVDHWGHTSALWWPWYMDRPTIEATVTSPGGDEISLDPKTITEAAAYPEAPDIYSDTRVLRAPLPSIAVGSVVEEVVTTKTKRPFFCCGHTHHLVFQSSQPRDAVELVVELPAGAPFHYEIRDAKVEVEDETADGKRRLVFRGGPYEGIQEMDPFAPYDVPRWPHVVFSTGQSWNALAKAYAKVVEAKLQGEPFEGVVDGVVDSDDDPKTKAQKLLRWLRKRVRYVGVEFGESAIIPRPPAETLKRGYGDCKDQSIILAGLLREADVPANVVLLRAGLGEDLRKDTPTLNVFNHAIVVIPGEPPIWIDPSAPFARAGELPGPDQGRLALVVAEDTAELTVTPTSGPEDNTYREVRQVHLPDIGRGRIVEKSTATGYVERDLRSTLGSAAADLKGNLEKYVAKAYNEATLGEFSATPAADLERPFQLRVEAKDVRVAITDVLSADAILDWDVLFGWVPTVLSQGEERKAELVLPAAYRATLRYEVHPPEGFAADKLIPTRQTKLGPAVFRQQIETRGDGTVQLDFVFDLAKRRWSAAEVLAFRKAFAKLRATPHPRVSFIHQALGHQRAQNRKEELDTYRRLIKKHPKSGLHKLRLAIGLIDLGFGDAARRLTDEAVRLDPKRAALHQHRAGIFSRDTFGRAYHEGYDRSQALAGFQKAAELDPDDIYSKLQIAIVYEHDRSGQRYGPNSQLDKAIAQYDKLDSDELAAFGQGEYKTNALFALMWAGRFEETKTRLAGMKREDVPPVIAVVAAAALGGPSEGLAEMTRLSVPTESRAQVLTSAGDTLVRFRKYPEAAALTEAAAASSGDAALQVRARTQKRTKRIDAKAMPTRTPEQAVTRALVMFASYPEQAKEKLREIVSSRSFNDQGKTTLEAVLKGMTLGRKRTGLSPAVVADALAASFEIKKEGSPDTGYRLKLHTKYGGSTTDSRVFVVRERGGYRIRTFGTIKSEIGCEALYLVRAGKTRQATQWLKWGREQVSAGGGEDPLRMTPFARLWVDDKGDVELAAAALCAEGKLAGRAIGVLEAALPKATEAEQRIIVLHALALAYQNADRPKKWLDTAQRLEKLVPDSKRARGMLLLAMGKLDRFKQARDRLRVYLKKKPKDRFLREMRAMVEDQLGNPREARRIHDGLIASGDATAMTYNSQAWRSLFIGQVRDQDISHALRAVQTHHERAKTLHTLACVYAEVGRVHDAHQTLMKILELRDGGRPESHDWWILGRIAEHLSLPKEARAAYRRVTRPEDPHRMSTYSLAQKRLKALR